MFDRISRVFAAVAILATAFWAFRAFQDLDPIIASPPGKPAAQATSFDLALNYPTTPRKVGESFLIQAWIRGVSGTGERGGISISFPQIEDGQRGVSTSYTSADGDRRYQGDYASSAADISLVATGGMAVFTYRKGDAIQNPSLPEMTARHLLIESEGIDWDASSERILQLQITPNRAGEFRFEVRGWICADGYQNCEREPRPDSGEWQDQQGMSAVFASVAIEPAPASEEVPVSPFVTLLFLAGIAVVIWAVTRD